MMLQGKSIPAKNAKRMGLVDLLVEPLGPGLKPADERTHEYLEEVAIKVAHDISTGQLKFNRQRPLTERIIQMLMDTQWFRNMVFNKAKEQVMKASRGLYPAPLKILEVVKTGLEKGPDFGYSAEHQAFGELAMTPQCKGLMNLFHGTTETKKNRFGNPAREPK